MAPDACKMQEKMKHTPFSQKECILGQTQKTSGPNVRYSQGLDGCDLLSSGTHGPHGFPGPVHFPYFTEVHLYS